MISVEILTNQNITALVRVFLELGKTAEIFNQYVHEQLLGQRITWIAHYKGNIAGYICLLKN